VVEKDGAYPTAHLRVVPGGRSDGQLNVLIVDDSTMTAKALANLLRGSGFQPVVFHMGLDALEFAKTATIDAAVIDIHLPDINGLVLSQKLREALGPDIAIIVLSGDTSMQTLKSLPHVGATYFFSKPVHAAQLIERLQSLVAPR